MPIPTRRLLLLLAAGLPLALAAGVWTGFGRVPWLAALLGSGLAALADLLLRPRRDALGVERELDGRLALGRATPLRIRLSLAHGLPCTVRVRLDLPPELDGPAELGPVRLRAGHSAVLAGELRPRERGSFDAGDLHLRCRTPLGLWELPARFPGGERLSVLPDFRPGRSALRQIDLIAEPGRRPLRRRGEGLEFDSLREYRPGEDASRIDWKATARRGKPVSRQYRVERDHDLILALDAGRLMGARFHGAAKFEHALQAALALAEAGTRAGDRVGLMVFDAEVRAFLAPGKGPAQIGRLLEAVHALRAGVAETSFPAALGQLGVRQRKRALVVIFTDFIDSHTAAPMLESLLALRGRHAFLFVAVADPTLEEALDERPESTAGLLRQAAAYEMRRDRRVVLEQLRRMGVPVVDELPHRLVAPVLDAYLDLRASGAA